MVLTFIADHICTELTKRQIICTSDVNIYHYGIESLTSTLFTSLSILMLSFVYGYPELGGLYLLMSIPLKMTVGGYHANTYLHCYILSHFLFTVTVVCHITYFSITKSPYFCFIVIFFSTFYIWINAPVRNHNHPVGEKTVLKNKKRAQKLLLLMPLISIVYYICGSNPCLGLYYTWVVTSIVIGIMPVKIKERRQGV